MSAVQAFLFDRLSGDPALSALVGEAIYDAAPPGDFPELSVILGAEDVQDASDKTARARLHRSEVEIVTRLSGFAQAKDVAGAVRKALDGASGPAGAGYISRVQFKRAQSLRDGRDGVRRIRMRFDIFFDEN